MKTQQAHTSDETKLLVIILMLILCFFLHAAYGKINEHGEKDSVNVGNHIKPTSPNRSVLFSGYFDSYYLFNLNRPATRNNLGACGCARGFDRYSNQFQIGMLLTHLSYVHGAIEFQGEIGFGPNMEYANYSSAYGYRWGTVLANNTHTSVFIKQAYASVKATTKLSIIFGQFGSHIGYEVIDSPLNFHYSISNAFNAGVPFFHVGIKASYKLKKNITVMAGLVNGTDNMNNNNNAVKAIAQFVVKSLDRFELSVNTIQGNEANARTNGRDTISYFGIIDAVSSYQVSKKVKVSLWALYGSQRGEFQGGPFFDHMVQWSSLTVYTQYNISEVLAIGARVEHFDNRDGARLLLTNNHGTYADSVTLTATIQLQSGTFLLKPEIRTDYFQRQKNTNGETALSNLPTAMENFQITRKPRLGWRRSSNSKRNPKHYDSNQNRRD